MVTDALLVGAGAALGATARFVLGLPAEGASLALTLALNIAGSFAMGLFVPGKFWGAGFLGGFTTFSAVTVAAVSSTGPQAAALIFASFATCVAGWLAGDALRQGAKR
ncbi:CrcB family protein [Corynebacterium mayonis]|uniref:CrcB family protein n=1 Tax=Corynebacterium mayonis TaxID=3062461 RepID=UPI0031403735